MIIRTRNKYHYLVIIGLVCLAAGGIHGCGSPEKTTTPASPQASIIPTTTSSPVPPTAVPDVETPDPEHTASPIPEASGRPQYFISASLDYLTHYLTVQERILVPHPSQSALDHITLIIPPNNWPGVFSIQDIKSNTIPLETFHFSGVQLTIMFSDQGWQPGEELELEIHYTLNLPQMNTQVSYGPSAFGYSELQTNLVDWYPMVPPYDEAEGWLIHDPWFFGEYLVYPVADFEISLELGTPDLVVAASTQALVGDGELHYSLEAGRNFVFSISPSYQIFEGESNGTKIVGYFFPGYQIPGQASVNTTLEAWTLFQELYGVNEQPVLSIIQADFNHSLEFEGVYFQSRGNLNTYSGSEKSYLTTISAHETAHQWWYGLVANDQALEPWLDEALCTFSELVYYERLHPEGVDWWWETRVNYYQPVGTLDRSIYGFTQYIDQYLMYRNATYLRGAKFMSELKTVMGEEVFFTFLVDYREQFENKIASGDDFFALLEDYMDLSSQEWLLEYFPDRFAVSGVGED